MAYFKTVFYIMNTQNLWFVKEVTEEEAKKRVMAGEAKLYDKQLKQVVDHNPWAIKSGKVEEESSTEEETAGKVALKKK